VTDSTQHTVIPFPCPACQTPLRAAAARAGKPLNCPACGGHLVVPTALPEPPATVHVADLEATLSLHPLRPPRG
jgi:hypothetical protein